MSRNDLNGKVVLIAGGAKNLGGLLSRNFAQKGAKVAVHYNSDSTKADAEKTLAEITNAGGEAFLFQADLTKVENIAKLFEATKQKFGGIDIAINTVGMVLKKPFLETTEVDYDTMFDKPNFQRYNPKKLRNCTKTENSMIFNGIFCNNRFQNSPIIKEKPSELKTFHIREISVL